jgi:hypothetical protein
MPDRATVTFFCLWGWEEHITAYIKATFISSIIFWHYNHDNTCISQKHILLEYISTPINFLFFKISISTEHIYLAFNVKNLFFKYQPWLLMCNVLS